MAQRIRIGVTVEGMEYDVDNDSWTAKGTIMFHHNNKSLPWSASNKSELIIKLPEEKWGGYPEDTRTEIRNHIRSALGNVNLPYSKTYMVNM